jgi:oligoendopeptidase F
MLFVESLPKRKERKYLPEDLSINTWQDLESFVNELLQRKIQNVEEFENWLVDVSEFEMITSEDYRWRYIKTSVNTNDNEAKNHLESFILHLSTHLDEFSNEISKKILASPFLDSLKDEGYKIYIRGLKKDVEIFRKQNVEIAQHLNLLVNEYDSITGGMSIVVNEKEIALTQAAIYLKSTDRATRETVFKQINERRSIDENKLDLLLDNMIAKRDKIATNAGYSNFRDYQFDALNRFDYTAKDCFVFHNAVQKVIVPIQNEIILDRKKKLGLDVLKPWDLEVDVDGKEPLKPCASIQEFIEKNIECLNSVDEYFGSRLDIMNQMNYLDLDARKGKAGGGYNMTMPEIGVPFIFMNANLSENDIRVMTHEAGHAVHSFLAHPLKLNAFKSTPSEVAELASMSMELFCMDNWKVFYKNETEQNAAQKRHIEGILGTFSSVSMIDSFQHWIYENPNHTHEERCNYYFSLQEKFGNSVVDWTDLEKYKKYMWQRVLHIYHVPFYYIEYAFAQLGAVAMYKQYKNNKGLALENYKKALKLGYTRPIGDIYKEAGIKFDFSEQYVADIIGFLKDEYDLIK